MIHHSSFASFARVIGSDNDDDDLTMSLRRFQIRRRDGGKNANVASNAR